MMDHVVSIDESAEIVICTARGILNVETATSISLPVNAKAYSLGYSVIYDLSQTQLFANILDAYEFPRDRTALFGEAKHIPRKIAIIRPRDQHHDFWEFYETTARNSGLTLKVFDSLDEARKWCKS